MRGAMWRDSLITAGREIVAFGARHLRPLLRPVTRTGMVPPDVWRRLPVEGTFEVQLSPAASFRYRSTRGDMIGRNLCWTGVSVWEHETISAFMAMVPRCEVFLDVGANTGVYSLIAAAISPTLRAVAFEPLPAALSRLDANVRLNGWSDRIRVVGKAVSDRSGTVPFHAPFGELPTSASLAPGGFRGVAGEVIQVESVRLDDEVGDLPVDLVKIDVEFFEHDVIRGMPELLRRRRPILIVECHPDGPVQEVEDLLAPLGYRFVHLRPGATAVVLDRIDASMPGASRNIVCVQPGTAPWT